MNRQIFQISFILPLAFSLLSTVSYALTSGNFEYRLINSNTEAEITDYLGPGGAVSIPAAISGKPATSIGNYAFDASIHMTSITLPSTINQIGIAAFASCRELTSIIVDPDNSAYHTIDSVLFESERMVLVLYPAGRSGPYTIPEGVTEIGSYAFHSADELPSVSIPGSVTRIGKNAFNSATSLTSITIPESVTSIDEGIFYGCSNLASVILPSGTTSIPTRTFIHCTELAYIKIPDSVTSIGDGAFYFCSRLTSIKIPKNVTHIERDAFRYCSRLISVYFEGPAPRDVSRSSVFSNNATGFRIYFWTGAEGFTSPIWNGYITATPVNRMNPGFSHWRGFNAIPSSALMTDDLNGDGISLLMAYALDLDPDLPDRADLPQASIDDNTLSTTYFAGRSNIAYTPKQSVDLTEWSTNGVSLTTPDADGYVTASAPKNDNNTLFLQLVVNEL